MFCEDASAARDAAVFARYMLASSCTLPMFFLYRIRLLPNQLVTYSTELSLASCLINAQPLPAHSPAADDNSLTGCTSHDLTDDWSLASIYFVDSQYPFRWSFGCVLLLNQMF